MTVYVVDTDILSLYQRNHPQVCTRIRLARQNNLIIKTTVITVEEQYGGRLAQIRKAQNPEYDRSADDYFRQFRQQGIRIGTQDLRIASIVLAHGGIIVTRNQKDFGQVPGLTIEDWSLE
jgi:tRNA(fMet)-specific endonuclease VapC